MDKTRLAAQSRSNLDKRLKQFGRVRRFTTPVRGWTKAVREALGMTTAQLATRLGVKQPTQRFDHQIPMSLQFVGKRRMLKQHGFIDEGIFVSGARSADRYGDGWNV